MTQSSLEKERELKRDGTGMKRLKRNWLLQSRPSLMCHRPRSLPPNQISKHLPRKKLLLTSPEKLPQKRKLSTRHQQRKNHQQTKKTEGDKSGEKRSKAKEKQAKQSAEVECRKSLATQFLKAVSPSENLDNLTNEDNGHENGLMTAEHDVTYIATKLPRFNDNRDQISQSIVTSRCDNCEMLKKRNSISESKSNAR